MNQWKKMIIALVVALLALPLYATTVLADADLEYKYEEKSWGKTYENVKINGIDVSELLGSGDPYPDGNSVCFPQADGSIKRLDIHTYNNNEGQGRQGNITDLNNMTYDANTKTLSVEVSWEKYDDWHVDDVVFSACSRKKNWWGIWKTTEENIISPQRAATTAGYATTTDSNTSYKYQEKGYENVKITDIDVTDLVDSAAGVPYVPKGEKSIYFPQSDGSVKRLDINTYNNENGMGDITDLNGFEYDPVSRTVSVRVSWQYYDNWHVDDIITSGTHVQGSKEYKEIIPSQKISTESTTQFSNGLKEMDHYQDGSSAIYVAHVQADFLKDCEPGNNGTEGVVFINAEEGIYYTLKFNAVGIATQDIIDIASIEKQPDGSYIIKVKYDQGMQDQDMNIETSLEKYSMEGPPFRKLELTAEEEEQWGGSFSDTFTTVQKPDSEEENPWSDSQTTHSEGTGSYEKPYLITAKNLGDVCVIQYEELPFHFFLGNDENSQPGTYLVDLDIAKKQVRFKLISYGLEVGFVPEHSDDDPNPEDYVIQVGVEAVNLVRYGITRETKPAYLITQIANSLALPTVVNLRNGFNNVGTSLGGRQQHEAAFVFVQRNRNTITSENWATDIVYQFAEDVPSEQAGWLEKAVTRFLKFLGDMFLKVIKTFLGEDLTIDRIIFNQYEPTIIDLEAQRGILGQADVRNLINTVYKAFVAFAVSVYVIILLYIAIKTLLVVGTHEQGKYRNYITDWLVGLALLLIAPIAFRYIPSLSNAIIERIGGDRKVLYTYYNNGAELDSDKYGVQGEDPRSIRIEELIGLRELKYKELEQAQAQLTLDEATVNQALFDVAYRVEDRISGQDADLSKEHIDEILATNMTFVQLKNDLFSVSREFEKLKKYSNESMEERKVKLIEKLKAKLKADIDASGVLNYHRAEFEEQLYSYIESAVKVSGLEYEIEDLTARIEAPDLMGEMRSLAGKTDRFIYALVWWICIFQMIGVLCLYYRRIIMMAMLIMIYPLVAVTYPLDKIKDGKAQSMSLWYKEFTVNILVQIVHAVVYIVLIETGISLYQDNPKNWLFLLLSILFIFPAERMMRGIFGLSGSTIGNLKFSALSAIGGTAALVGATKDVARATNRKAGITERGKEEKAKAEKKKQKEKRNRDNRDAYLQGRADIKAHLREKNRDYRKRNAAYVGRMRRAAYAVANTASKARDAAYKVGNKGRKLKGQWRRLQDSRLAKYAKGTWKVARGAAGIAFGSASFVTSAGQQGLGTGIYNGIEQGRIVGGFQNYGKLPKQTKDYRTYAKASTATAKASSTARPTAGTATTTGTTRMPKPGTGKVTKRIAQGLTNKKKTETVRIEDEKK